MKLADFLMSDAAALLCSTDATFVPADLAQGRWVLFFYPRDATAGCTTEVQQFRDQHAVFVALGWQVAGVSRDSLRSHERFVAAQQLSFALLSDPAGQLCEQFAVIKDKQMYGKTVRGIERSSFLLQDGDLIHSWRKVKADGHAAAVLAMAQQHSTS